MNKSLVAMACLLILALLLSSLPLQVAQGARVPSAAGRPVLDGETWYDSHWLYRRAINITNLCGRDVSDFQVQITLNATFDFTKANLNASDVRITESDGVTPVPFWIETWDPTTSSASIWIKAPIIPVSGATVYLYYGNPEPIEDPAPVEMPPTGPWTRAAGNPIIPIGDPQSGASLLAENIVYDEVTGLYWLLYANYRNNSVGLVWSDDPSDPAAWHWDGTGTVIPSANAPHILKDNNTWYIFYSDWSGPQADQHSIMVRSASAITGPYTNPITVLSPSEPWEAWRVDEPYVFKRNDGKWVMMYMADSGGAHEQVSYATADAVTGPYTKFGTSPAIPWGPAGSYDSGTVADPWVVEFEGTYYIGYTVSSTIFSPWQTAYATTTDWQTFTKRGLTLPLGPAGAWDAPNSFRGAVTRFGDTYYFSYTGDAYRMGIATQDVYRAPTASIGAQAVFPFFDDFNDDSFDTNKWGVDNGGLSQVSESGGNLTLTATNMPYVKISGRTSFGMNYLVETRARHPQAGYVNLIAETGMAAGGFNETVRIVDDFPDILHWQRQASRSGAAGTITSMATASDTDWHTFRTYRLAPNVAGYQIDGNPAETDTATTPTGNLFPFLMSYSESTANQFIVDWIRVRQYCGANPTVTVGAEEQYQSLGRIDISMTGPATPVEAGSTVEFTITINNTGGADLHNVAVTDSLAPDCARAIGDLVAGANTSFTCTLANMSDDFTNSATVTGLTTTDVQVSDTALFQVDVIHPALTISMAPDSQVVYRGGAADFQITVTNTGDVNLTGMEVVDAASPPCNRPIGTLTPGANSSYTCRLLNILGNFTNTAVASGTPPVGAPVTASDSTSVSIIPLTTGSWFDTAWGYRQPIIISPPAPPGQPAQAVTEFQVRVLLDSTFGFARALADGSDLRVTSSDGTTLIPFWIESWNPGTSRASMWVRVPSIPLSSTLIYIYYGNPAPGSPPGDPVAQPPAGPYTKLAGNPITTFANNPHPGCTTQILPENIVVQNDKLWLIVSDRCTSPNSLALLSHPASDPNLTANWTFEAKVLDGVMIGNAGRQMDSPHIVQDGSNWYLFYSTFTPNTTCGCSWNETYPATIGIAKSTTGILGPYTELSSAIFGVSSAGGWDDARVAEPYVLKRANGDWVMVYMGDAAPNGGWVEQVGIAVSTSGIEGPYMRDDPEPEIAFGPSGSLDAGTIADPWVVNFNGVYYVGYTASPDKDGWNTTYATTTDWVTFTKSNRVILGQGPGAWDGISSFRGAVTLVGDQYLFPYTGQGAPGFQFGIATQPYEAAPPSVVNNPDAVFEFYDGFDGTQVDSTKWTISETGTGTGSAAVSGGKLTLSTSATGTGFKLTQMVGNTTFGPGMLLEGMARHPNADGTGHTAAEVGFSDAGRSNMLRIMDYNNAYFIMNAAANGAGGNTYFPMLSALNTFESMHRIYWAGSSDVRFSFGEDPEERLTANIPTTNIPPWLMVYSDASPYQGTLEMDWIRVRKWIGAGAGAIAGPEQGCDRSVTWVDDGYTPGGGNGGHTWGCTGFARIQNGIDKVTGGGTVNVAAGTYDENVMLNKAVTVTGNGDITLNGSLDIQAGAFNAPPGAMSLTGNLNLSGGSFNSGSGTVIFNGTGVQNLNAPAITFHNLNTGADAILATAGEVTLTGALSNLGFTRETKTVSGTPTLQFNLAGITVAISGQGTLTQLQVDRRDQNHEAASQGIQTGKYWTITPNTAAANFTANLTLPHYDTPDTSDKICRYTGTAEVWDCAASSFDTAAQTITRNGVTQFSPWATGNNVGPTAVELIDLSARPAPGAASGSMRLLFLLLGVSILALGAARITRKGHA